MNWAWTTKRRVERIISIFCVMVSVVSIANAAPAKPKGQAADSTHKAPASQIFKDCSDCPEMVTIPAGTHTLFGDRLTPDKVDIGRFALGSTAVTQAQWRSVMGNDPSNFSHCGDNCPVEQVSWDDAQQYLQKLSQRTGRAYRLPTEAEWEYACMAGNTTTYCGGEDVDRLAWYGNNGWPGGNSGQTTHPVATKQPNGFGLYDMSGNVWQWTQGCYNTDCSFRISRGGAFVSNLSLLRADSRNGLDKTSRVYAAVGFRVARTAP